MWGIRFEGVGLDVENAYALPFSFVKIVDIWYLYTIRGIYFWGTQIFATCSRGQDS